MGYSDKVIKHYENPSNVGTLDKNDPTVGTGLVGAPACGDVMRLQLKINPETEIIEDAKFKTFGCVVSDTEISIPGGSVKAENLQVGTTVYSWDGTNVLTSIVEEVLESKVPLEDIRKIDFNGKFLITSKDHILVNTQGKPVETEDSVGEFIFEISKELGKGTYSQVKEVNPLYSSDSIKTNSDGTVTLYDFRLTSPHVYFTNGLASHNCGSAIASSSLITEWVIGKNLDEASSIKNSEIAEELSLPPVKIHCSLLAEDAIKSAISDFRKKQGTCKKL